MKKIRLLCTFGFALLINQLIAQLPAFPTAEGAGKFVTGGRGTLVAAPIVLEVTSLADNSSAANTPGTFRYACTKSGFAQRIIVFRVSGTIHLYAALTLNRANTTIAGQTAPGEGICLADYPVKVSANNIIIRYLRFRLGDKNQAASLGNDDAFDGVGAQRVIIDHCTMSWSNDEACTFYSGDNITLQWNLISEPLDYSYHDEGSGIQNHAYGGIWGGKHASFHHNLIAHCKGRMPRFDGIRNIPADSGDFRNNVIYNWGDYNTNGGEGGAYNVVNNYYKYGPNTPNNSTSGVNRKNMLINPGNQASPVLPFGKYYLSGNYCDNSATISADNWKGAAFSGGTANDSNTSRVTVPFNCININMQSAQDAYRDVLLLAGCSLPNRDTLDQRIVNDVKNRTGRLINVQGGFPAGTAYAVSQIAWPTLQNGTVQTDTDHDGMPDSWENARGLNASSATDINGYVSTSGYSNIENYINGDTIVAVGKAQTCIGAKQLYAANSGNWLWAKDSSYSNYLSNRYTAATDSNHIVAAILDNGNFGAFNTSYYTCSLLRYDAVTAKPYLSRNITITPADPLSISSPITGIDQGVMRRTDDYLTYYQIAKEECADIIASGVHQLNPNYKDLWKNKVCARAVTDPQHELMFQVGAIGSSAVADTKLGYYNGPTVNGLGNKSINILPTYFYSFDSTDTRRDVTCAAYAVGSDGATKTGVGATAIVDGKYRRDWLSNPTVLPSDAVQYFGLKWQLIRYSDVLLMFAEAENELDGPTAAAYDAVNQVRRRGFGLPLSTASDKDLAAGLNKTAFFEALIKERSFELGGEGLRKYDLIRWNLLGTKIQETRAALADLQARTGRYTDFPTSMYYKNGTTADDANIFANSLYAPTPSTSNAPPNATRVAWIGSSITTTILARYAVGYTANKSELMPIPNATRGSNSNLSQNPGY